ncbi:hypothetical protein JMJ77_0014361 [Colletotrichum scovillei]|uniref:Uncharacterized protein n=1 Tax=Colletotrichum scovillei TaxID=1209932 RepID=A0A9P7UBM2_9PEZI|nr:hypothetical protein JMJ77_0014361 [Colletotrichum scovillei]KAG7065892.1 hypothetical protein JMJ78_0012635 [Colletotrichum scovillei]KAG7068493.1 hypothetical protein JMJ76_0008179 [Colletotrichum scovillei]
MNLGSNYACFEANGIRAASNDKLTMVTGRRLLRTPYPTQLSSLNCSVFSVHLFTGLGRRGGPLFACKGHGRATQLCQHNTNDTDGMMLTSCTVVYVKTANVNMSVQTNFSLYKPSKLEAVFDDHSCDPRREPEGDPG